MLGNGLKRPLVALTLSAGLSQADLAERSGKSQRFIAQLASGAVQNVEADILEKLGIALDVSAAAE
jgi:transcriptional regulator with XRE-family HTH domain